MKIPARPRPARSPRNDAQCSRHDDHLRNHSGGSDHRRLRRIPAADEPGAMDSGRAGLRSRPDLAADGRRGLYDVRVSRRQRVGLFAGRADALHCCIPYAGLRCLVLYSAQNLGGRTQILAPHPGRLLPATLREQVSGSLGCSRRLPLHYSVPATAAYRSGPHRPDRQLRRHKSSAGHHDRIYRRGRIRTVQRHSRCSVGQRAERHPDAGSGIQHRHRSSLPLFRRNQADVPSSGAGQGTTSDDAGKYGDHGTHLVYLHGSAYLHGLLYWPHAFCSVFTAKSGNTLRRNAVIMPLYTITLPLLFFVGYTAILVTPGLKNGDLALLSTVRKTFSPWFLGLVGGAGALTAMVPAAILILAAGTLFAKNFFRPLFAPSMSDAGVAKLAKVMVVVITALAMYFAIYSSTTLVGLLLFAYSGIAQFFPGVVLGLFWKRVTALGVFAGLVVGVGCDMFMIFTKHDPFHGLYAAFIALCLNLIVTTVVSATTAAEPDRFEEQVETAVAAEAVM